MPGDDPRGELREQLVCDNLRLAYYFARRAYRDGCGLELEDLEQEAVLGLMAAAGLYDPQGHPRMPFGTWARPYIVRHVNEAIERWQRVQAEPLPAELADPETESAGELRLALEVWEMVQELPQRCQALVVRRYGLDERPAWGLLKLSAHFGLPSRTVGRLLQEGRSLLRAACIERGLAHDAWAQGLAAEIA